MSEAPSAPTEPESAPPVSPAPSDARPQRARNRDRLPAPLLGAVRVLAAVAFVTVLVVSGKLGIDTAKKRHQAEPPSVSPLTEEPLVTLGEPANPLYFSDSATALREFFTLYGSAGERASASLTDSTIRRITSPVELAILRTEADVVEVRVVSGAIAGAVYWIHHSQIPDPQALDPIIDPLPR